MSRMPKVDPTVDHILGVPGARIVIVEYGDFECPYCGLAYPELQRLRRTLGPPIALVFRHFPLVQMHPHALRAAAFAQAAATLGRFWDMHDLLFEHQSALEEEDLAGYGHTVGMSDDLIDAALGDRFEASVLRDFQGGVHCGVNGTPCLFINGTRYDGPVRSDALHRLLVDFPTGDRT